MMSLTQRLLLSAATLAVLQGCVINADGDRDYRGGGRASSDIRCGGEHRLRVVDLDMSPDPISDGDRINRFTVRLRADSSGECQTTIYITDGDETIARTNAYRLRPGENQIIAVPQGRYRFERDEHCFTVKADIDRSNRAVDSERKFCAKRSGRGRWTLKS